MSQELEVTAAPAPAAKPPVFHAPTREWVSTTIFFLLLSAYGLKVYPNLLIILAFLVWRWRNDRYAFLVEFMILCGGYGFARADILPLKLSDVAFAVGIFGMLIYRKWPTVRRLTLAFLGYVAIIFLIASTSTEPIKVQFIMMRNYFYIVAFFLPLIFFANRDFDFRKLIHAITVHVLVICALYTIDALILGGYLLVPACHPGEPTTLFNLSFSGPLANPRHYPYGLYWLVFLIIPLSYKWFRLNWKQWVLILLALFTSRTNSLLMAGVVCMVFFRPKVLQAVKISLVAIVTLAMVYTVDRATGDHLRVAFMFDQFTALDKAIDEGDVETMAEFGTGRMAQIIPKWLLLYDLDRQWLGFGFLHPQLTTNPIYQINNALYTDVSKSEEVVTAVEETHVQTILDCGFLGLIAQTGFYLLMYYIIRRMKYANFYLCAFVFVELLGVGGFAGVTQRDGLFILATALGGILAANKPKHFLKPIPVDEK